MLREHGFPLRLIAPGWYDVANVKWLTRIEVTDQRFAGRFMAREYVTIREQVRDGQTVWTFHTVNHTRLKSAPAKVTDESAVGAADPSVAALPQKTELAPSARPAPSVGAYSLELGLLQRARAAVASGRFSAALRAIAEHQRRFPAGHLQEEREALRVKALAGLGKTDEAHRAAEKFRSRFPDSVLSPRIEGAIQEAP